jgi:hypothetical protein
MTRIVYNVGKLRKAIKESADNKFDKNSKNEFKPVYGKGVQDDNKEINRKAYNDIKKETSSYDGNLSGAKKLNKLGTITPTENRGMSDLEYDGISQPFKDKVKSQLKGYTSADAEKNHSKDNFGNAEFNSKDESEFFVKHAKEAKKEKDKMKGTGLTGSTQNKSEIEKRSDTMFESKKIKNIKFKHTEFLTEGHMLSKVPDEFKTEGNKFMMSDSEGNSYMIEWHTNDAPDVEKKINKKLVNEEMNRIKSLYNYHSKDYFNTTTAKSRVNENKEFSNLIDRARELMK